MYQVVTMYGDNEPWWFFEDWKEDIEENKTFNCLEDAERYYIKKWQELSSTYEYINTKVNYLAAFWSEGDERWCEECDEDLQQYKGLALLKDLQAVTFESGDDFHERHNDCAKPKCCKSSLV
ncbi:hypothetical protein UAW_02841 [Enterococcus haemoperoxidus ATCC BAA-382]|uniref:Uncharacterized protein n=1 Tax=Enterococcus haemoperoxidus ATCC BAA-382 TaxID=1158608 RepID=R2SB92_9ENTE|nr:DUF1033 family protein [Enterococcus haemoperoxidus]EOH92800.1 hypothetical protein UAW_02841 [Enterococcus haemoperoxidus ATCC BAA-382]EOT61543.1 hypothetical protein I583_00525 [Enterococcus haemoperoxidus ATCC BAA-382]OJG55376.1 hypothetical protein RV06_GL001819 [Enterococcus haemoperoxidus]